MSSIRRIGLSWEPPQGWPLDVVLGGPALVRVVRELCGQRPVSFRPWDLALRTGVTPQGCRKALLRLERTGLVYACVGDEGSAEPFALDLQHRLVPPLRDLFAAEFASVRSAWPERRFSPERPRLSGPGAEDGGRR